MQRYLLVVDTETSGMPESVEAQPGVDGRWPYLLQIAWQIWDWDQQRIKSEAYYLYEPEFRIQPSAQAIHGIQLHTLKEKGHSRQRVLRQLLDDLQTYRPLIVGHFVAFDSKMLQVGLLRAGLPNVLPQYTHFCTMRASTDYKRFPNHNYPSLEQLYYGLFRSYMEKQHDAAYDAEITGRCFFELLRKGDIDPRSIWQQDVFGESRRRKSKNAGCAFPLLSLVLLLILMLQLL